MRVLVCGGRNWDERPEALDGVDLIEAFLQGLADMTGCGGMGPAMTVIEGQCPSGGADLVAERWAISGQTGCGCSVDHEGYPADWDGRPRWAAGPERNQRMLNEGKPDLVLAFKNEFNWNLDRGGTENMVLRAQAAGIPTYVISRA